MKKTFAAAIFLGSFVSFALEPMIGRALLPVFGGTPSVWVTCLAAFQVLMVGGYFYAERRARAGLRVHIAMLVAAAVWCCALSFLSAPVLGCVAGLTGVGPLDVLVSVLVLSGFAFILLSANATIVQRLSGGDYRLYAVSNLGSLLGLFAYPLLVEPFVGLSRQWLLLGGGIFAYAAILLWSARCAPCAAVPRTESPSAGRSDGPAGRAVLYFLLPAASCALLNATTAHLTLDIAPLPLLWAVLLGVFLLSYIIGFSGLGRSIVWALPAAASTWFALNGALVEVGNSIYGQIAASGALLFFGCTMLHSWLYELRPGAESLGRYYLLNALGGAAGGLLTAVVPPLVFPSVLEYPIAIYVCAALIAAWAFVRFGKVAALVAFGLFGIAFAQVHLTAADRYDSGPKVVHRSRGFFGTIRVMEPMRMGPDRVRYPVHTFYHGETLHGIESLRPGEERMPTCYYTPYACGYAIWAHPNYIPKKPMRVNLVGLGVGVLCAYGHEGDLYRAYEISPEVLSVARDKRLFRFVSDCPAKVELVEDDARKGLERELAEGGEPYDVIVVDAFTGDNIPYHLSTKEALELYFRMLKPDGTLCIHFSNKHLDLAPYVKRIGEEFGIEPIVLESRDDPARLGFASLTAFFSRNPSKLGKLPVTDGYARRMDLSKVRSLKALPTDDKGSFLPLLSP